LKAPTTALGHTESPTTRAIFLDTEAGFVFGARSGGANARSQWRGDALAAGGGQRSLVAGTGYPRARSGPGAAVCGGACNPTIITRVSQRAFSLRCVTEVSTYANTGCVGGVRGGGATVGARMRGRHPPRCFSAPGEGGPRRHLLLPRYASLASSIVVLLPTHAAHNCLRLPKHNPRAALESRNHGAFTGYVGGIVCAIVSPLMHVCVMTGGVSRRRGRTRGHRQAHR
jgi:hypothetical protein